MNSLCDNTFLYFDDGRLFKLGNENYIIEEEETKQINHLTEEKPIKIDNLTFYPILKNFEIKLLSVGYYHLLFLQHNGDLFGKKKKKKLREN